MDNGFWPLIIHNSECNIFFKMYPGAEFTGASGSLPAQWRLGHPELQVTQSGNWVVLILYLRE